VIETARFALASAALAGGERRQDDAEKLFRAFVADYEGKEDRSGLLGYLRAEAKRQADRIERCGLGKPAQKTEGDDLDGKPVALADHKGKVVLLVFWASWCGLCMADVPHEKELAEAFKGRPFVILGVNGDTDRGQALKAVEKTGMPWRSIWGGAKGAGGPHAEGWCVGGWPTVYVIDHAGVIRHNSLRGTALDDPIEELVRAVERAAGKK
jgi:thiol-disulfide isomerase/thioredoxin